MAEGITLRFLVDDRGRPWVMYLADVLVICPVCGRERVERNFRQTSFHSLTVAAFRALVETPPSFASSCEQCSEELSDPQVARWTITYGFPGEQGLIQGFGDRRGGVRFALAPYRAFDVQMQPQFEPEDDQSVANLAHITEDDIYRTLTRFLNPKAGWRRLLRAVSAEFDNDSNTPVWRRRLTAGCVAVVGSDRKEVAGAVDQLMADNPEDFVVFWLDDRLAALLNDTPFDWLGDNLLELLVTGELHAAAVGEVAPVRRALVENVVGLHAELKPEFDEDGSAHLDFPLGLGEYIRRSVDLRRLTLESLAVGAAPSDWMRYWLDQQVASLVE